MSRCHAAALVLATAAALAMAPVAGAQTTYLAFGDSITNGVGAGGPGNGYPSALETLLNQRGINATVINAGLPGETTAEGRNRLPGLLGGVQVLLLMEGTNDINADVSVETTRFNLAAMGDLAEGRNVEVVHATIIPRLPTAGKDPRNILGRQLAGHIRELAFVENRNLADPFYVFFYGDADAFNRYYVGGDDRFHLNAAGYDRLAEVFADVLTGEDSVPPVPGPLNPMEDERQVSPSAQVAFDLFDFGSGIDTGATRVTVDGAPGNTVLGGDGQRQTVRIDPPAGGWNCVVIVDLEAQDTDVPPNQRQGQLVQFVIRNTRFLEGDITRDCQVAGDDLVAFARVFGSIFTDGRYRTFADFNLDGVVDGTDLAILTRNFGSSVK